MPAKRKGKDKARGKSTAADPSVRPSRVPQVTAFLRAHGVKGLSLDRGTGFFYYRGVRLLALTNWSAETFDHARQRFEFLTRFEDILVSGEVKQA